MDAPGHVVCGADGRRIRRMKNNRILIIVNVTGVVTLVKRQKTTHDKIQQNWNKVKLTNRTRTQK